MTNTDRSKRVEDNRQAYISAAFKGAASQTRMIVDAALYKEPIKAVLSDREPAGSIREELSRMWARVRDPAMMRPVGTTVEHVEANPEYQAFKQGLDKQGYEVTALEIGKINAYKLGKFDTVEVSIASKPGHCPMCKCG